MIKIQNFLKRVFLTWLLLSTSCIVYSFECVNVAHVDKAIGTSSFGISYPEHFNQALANAFADAIVQKKGIYIDSETVLRDLYSNNSQNDLRTQQSLEEEIVERFSGFILQYELLDERHVNGGTEVEVEIQADVCMDPRIALNLDTTYATESILLSYLADNVRDIGWSILSTEHFYHLGSFSDQLDMLRTGATLLGTGKVFEESYIQRDGFFSHIINLDLSIYDSRTLNSIINFPLTGKGIGHTEIQAKREAIKSLANQLAKTLTKNFLPNEQSLSGKIYLTNIKRLGTPYTLAQMLESMRGVIAVDEIKYDEKKGTAEFTLKLSTDLCRIIDELLQSRRIIMYLNQCSNEVAIIESVRE